MTTTPTTSAAPASFNYRKLRPFSRAEFKFKFALGQYASERLLGKLQARARRIGTHNRYTGVNARVSEVIFLEAIVTNETEWGGFGFDFARLTPAHSSFYNLALRRPEDWRKAEWGSIPSASEYFIGKIFCPRASDWTQIARGQTFEQCVVVLGQEIGCV